MFPRTQWETPYTAEHCQEVLKTALEGPHDWEDVRGFTIGSWFRLKALTKPNFWRRGRLQYTLYGKLSEDGNGCTRITCRRFRGCTDPLTLVFIYVMGMLLFCLGDASFTEKFGLLFIAGLAVVVCAVVVLAESCVYQFRPDEADRLRKSLEDFLRGTLNARKL